MVFLLIGHDSDLCCRRVQTMLQQRGHEVWMTADPLAHEGIFQWNLETTRSASRLRPINRAADDPTWQGVLVRAQGGPIDADGWEPADLAYVRAEAQSALVAWLHDLPCPVVNRPTADLWFRPLRPYPEWRALFNRCGLPTLTAHVTDDLQSARRFAERWDGIVTYAPLTSHTRYPIVKPEQWDELAKVLERVPVCLIEPAAGPPDYATVVGSKVVWSRSLDLDEAQQDALDAGLRAFARMLNQALIQVELLVGSNGPCCTALQLYPQLEAHDPQQQDAIAAGIVGLLEGASA